MRLIIKYLFILLVLLGNCTLFAQSGNPFELKYSKSDSIGVDNQANPFELPSTATTDSITKEGLNTENSSTPPIKSASDNPFQLLDKPPSIVKNTIPQKSDTNKTRQIHKKSSSNFIFWVLLSLLLFLTAIASVSRKKLDQAYGSFINENLLRQVYRQNRGTFSLAYLLLYILFFLNLGSFIFLSANEFGYNLPNNFSFLLLLCGSVGIIFLIKHFLLFLMSSIFPIDKEIKLYSFTIMIFGILLGIALLPINILIAFASENIGKITVYVALGAIVAIYLYRSLRALSIASRYLMLHKFHFFLYLCAVEILPVIVLLKFILLWMD